MKFRQIPHSVVERLGWYVYAYIDRSSGRIDYIGKGTGQRALAHLMRLRSHLVDIIAHGLRDEAEAYAVERSLIEVLGVPQLVNKVRGKGATHFGREGLEDLICRYAAKRIDIEEPSVLIRVNRLYRPRMSADELYEVTRGVWKIGKRRDSLKYALAVYRGIVREVFRIDNWHPAGSTHYQFRRSDTNWAGRWEFSEVLQSHWFVKDTLAVPSLIFSRMVPAHQLGTLVRELPNVIAMPLGTCNAYE